MKKEKLFLPTAQKGVKPPSMFVEVSMEYAQVYRGLVQVFCSLQSVCAMKLFMFLLFEMNESNVATFDMSLIDKFNKQLDAPFHERTVRYALSELVSKKVLYKLQNGKYMADPEYCWVGDTKQRLVLIKSFQFWKKNLLLEATSDED